MQLQGRTPSRRGGSVAAAGALAARRCWWSLRRIVVRYGQRWAWRRRGNSRWPPACCCRLELASTQVHALRKALLAHRLLPRPKGVHRAKAVPRATALTTVF